MDYSSRLESPVIDYESVKSAVSNLLAAIAINDGYEWKKGVLHVRDGLRETPERVANAYREILDGYGQDPKEVFKEFDGDGIGGLIYLKDIEFYSTCEHHLLPFWGTAMIAYVPNGKVVGVSKLARLLDIFARRLQIQERIGEQVTDALMQHLRPLGAACLLEAKHFCISSRGVKKQHSVMGYSSLKGIFLERSDVGIAARAELMSLWGK